MIDKKELLQAVVDRHTALMRVFDDLGRLLGMSPESPLSDEVWKTFDIAVLAVGQQIGDETGALSWYIHENGCGAKGHEAGFPGDMRPIRTVEDLLWLIEVSA